MTLELLSSMRSNPAFKIKTSFNTDALYWSRASSGIHCITVSKISTDFATLFPAIGESSIVGDDVSLCLQQMMYDSG